MSATFYAFFTALNIGIGLCFGDHGGASIALGVGFFTHGLLKALERKVAP